MAEAADSGFDRTMFVSVLGALDQISDAAFTAYGISHESIETMRQRFASWRVSLLSASTALDVS